VYLVCLAFPPVARRPALFAGILLGFATSVFDRFTFNLVNAKAGFLVALFGIPGLTVVPLVLFLFYKARTERPAT